MALNNDTAANQTYSPQGASVVGGARGGNFFTPNNPVTPGIPVGNVYATYLKLNNIFSSVQLASISVPANTSMYVQFNSLTLPTGATLVPGQYINLEWGRALSISSTEANVTWSLSGYDLYDEKVTYGNTIATGTSPFTDITSRCFKKLTASKITNNSNAASTVIISLTPSIELPFYNFGTGSHLITFNYNVTSSLVDYTLDGMIAESTDANSPITWNFTINNPGANPLIPGLTQSTGTVRPWITLNDDGGFDSTSFEILIKQIVFGYGTLPSWIPETQSQQVGNKTIVTGKVSLNNNKVSIIGGTNYSTDWVKYQG